MKKITWLLAAMVLVAGPALAATPKDTVVMAKQIDDIISLDPAESFEFSGSEVTGNIYERLIAYDLNDVSKLKGELADSWSVGADGKTYTFKMKKGTKFASGNPVTAQDAAYSLQRAVIMNKTPGFILTQFGFSKDNAKEKIRATDDSTLVVETGDQVAPTFFYYCLTAVIGGIVDMKTVQAHEKDGDFGNEWLKTNSAGSGPFKLISWKANDSYVLERNDNYQGTKAIPRRVVVRHVAEPASQRLLLEKGDIDYARNLTKDQLDAIKGNANIATQQNRKGSLWYVSVNQKNPNLAKPEVREALKWLIDYASIEENILRGSFVVHQAFLPKGFLGAIDDKPYKFDLAKAKALLAKAGVPDGFSVTMDVRNTSPSVDIAQAIQASWAKAGIKLELLPGDGKQVITKYRARNHDVMLLQWGADYQDPHSNAETFAMNTDNTDASKSKTLAWRNSWDIPDMTKQTAAAVRERDAKKRQAMYEAIQREHQRVSPFIIMFQEIEVAAHGKNVDGFVIGPSFENNLYAGIKK
jgi:peptide/nickel transport system substrate-binding protein